MVTRTLAITLALVVALAVPAVAGASQLIDRNARGVKLEVNRGGQALLTYTAQGKLHHVLAWGAINAIAPTTTRPQVKLKLDYAGGWGTYRKNVWKTFKNACTAYDGPALAWAVAACKASDGSYWAVQSWQKMLPNLGFVPWKADQSAWELHLSHWTGPTAEIEAWLNWTYSGRFHALFGRLTYDGQPVHGFHTDSLGAPLDTYGRNMYLDTYNSLHGAGWKRENSFVAHNPTGVFCYGFYPITPYAGYPDVRGPQQGNGERYRITVIGPGVTPDVMWQANDPGDFSKADPTKVDLEKQMNTQQDQLGDKLCHQH